MAQFSKGIGERVKKRVVPLQEIRCKSCGKLLFKSYGGLWKNATAEALDVLVQRLMVKCPKCKTINAVVNE